MMPLCVEGFVIDC